MEDGMQTINTFSVWKFRLGIFDYLSRNPIFSGNFPFGKTKTGLPNDKQPETSLKINGNFQV